MKIFLCLIVSFFLFFPLMGSAGLRRVDPPENASQAVLDAFNAWKEATKEVTIARNTKSFHKIELAKAEADLEKKKDTAEDLFKQYEAALQQDRASEGSN